MDLTAFGLTAEYDGTVDIDGKTVPKFSGGMLNVGDGDFGVREALDAGDGVIVVYSFDEALVALLDTYPALKRVPVPTPAKGKQLTIVNPYARRSIESLRHVASLRDIGITGRSRKAIEAALLRHDAKVHNVPTPAPVADDDQAHDADTTAGDAGTTTTTGD